MSTTDEPTGSAPATSTSSVDGDPSHGDPSASAYAQVQRSPEFGALRARWRRYIFMMSGIFLSWFLVYVLLSDFAHDFVNARLGDTNFTVGLLLGLLQFVSTAVIATLYVRYADRNLDPDAASLRKQVEEKL